MFVQVIQGHVSDPQELRSAVDEWMRTVRPGSIGWLGTTAGVTEDGVSIALVRFESADAARQNSERPEQHQWWMETSKLFSGDVTFLESEDVETWMGGGADDAGFVQVMEGHVSDRKRADELMEQMEPDMSDRRPDILGGVVVNMPDGRFVQAVYFRSEAEAREGESKMTDEDMEDMNQVIQVEAFHDLKEPWLFSP